MRKILALAAWLVLFAAGPRPALAQQQPAPGSASAPATESGKPASQADIDKQAEAYYDFTLGHYYQQQYEIKSHADDANRSIEFFKKAYALDPNSPQIGEDLAEIYFQSQHIRDAVIEAQSILAKDPDNLPARRLLARIYVRTLGDLSDTSGQRDTLARATEQYTEILRLDPTDADASLWLARLYRLQNEHDKAEAVLRELLSREPENENGVEQLTQLLLDEGKSQEAITSLQTILARAPTASLWDSLGDAYTQTHDLPNAEMAYRKAIELAPDEISHYRGLAQTLLGEEKYPEALEQYQRLASMEADDPENYLRLAEIYLQMKQLDKAEQNVLLAKQRAPGNLEVIYYESTIYEAEQRFDDSIRVLSDAVTAVKAESEFTPSRRRTLAILYQQLGQLYRETSNFMAAENTFEEMQRLGPEEDQRARAMLIDTYRMAHDLPKALDASRKAIEAYPKERSFKISQAFLYGDNAQTDMGAAALHQLLDGTPGDFEIQIDLGQLYQQGRRWTEAEQALHAAEMLSRQPSEKEMAAFLLGGVFERQKKFDQAEKQFQAVLQENPSNAAVLNYYGYMLADRGVRLDEAIALIKRALDEDPSNSAYQDSLGWAYFKQNNLAEAEQWLQKALSHGAHDAEMLSHLGDIYAKAGMDTLAEAEWQKSLDEWRHVMPGDMEPGKIAELEQKTNQIKRRLAQQKTPSDAKP